MKQRVPDQEMEQRRPGVRLWKTTVKHENWTRRMLWIVVMEEVDKGGLMISTGMNGWMFLLVPASVRQSMPFSTDTDTPIFCCQPMPMRYRCFCIDMRHYPRGDVALTWRSVTDRSKAPDAAAVTNNSGGGADRLQRGGGCLWSVVDSQTQQLSVKFNIKNSNDLHANRHSRILQ